MLADSSTHRTILLEDLACLGVHRRDKRGSVAIGSRRAIEHAIESPREIHCRRPRCTNRRRNGARRSNELRPSLLRVRGERHNESHRPGNADRWRATHGERLDGIGHVVEGS